MPEIYVTPAQVAGAIHNVESEIHNLSDDIRVGTDGITYASAGDAVRNIGEKAAYVFEKAGYAKLVGGSGESWSVHEFTAKAGRKYTLTIPSFTVRSTLTTGYIAYEVCKIDTTTANRLAVSSIGNYNNGNHPVVTVNIDNSSERNDETIIVRLRPETNTVVWVTLDDVTDMDGIDTRVSALEAAVTPYFDQQTGTADFSSVQLNSTYQGKKVHISIPAGATVKIDIVSSAGTNDQNTLYMNMYNSTGTTRLFSTIGPGKGTRSIEWTNTSETDVGIIDLVLVKVLEQNTYTVIVTNGDFLPDKVDGLSNTVDELSHRVDEVSDPTYVVPAYFETQLSSAISAAKSNMLDIAKNGETFIFISDLHWSGNAKHSPALAKAITQSLPIDKLIFGGDAINGGTRDDSVALMDDIRQKFAPATKHFVSILGNHDTNALDGGTMFQKNEFYTTLQKQSDDFVTYGDYYYFYFDNSTTATRFICLDTWTGTPPYATYQAEIAWLQDVINTAPTGYHFLIFAHVVYYPDTGGSYNDPSTWISSTFMQDVFTVLDTAKANGKAIEAIFGGHCHMDYNAATSGGIPIVLIDCDGRQTVSGNAQTLGTTGEQAFDIVSVDYAAKTVKCVRIGRGSSRTITY